MFKPVRFDKPDTGLADGGGAEPTPSAPSPQGSVPVGTPSQVTPDAGPSLQKLQETLAQREKDINNIKSTLQRQQAEQKRLWDEERKQLQEDLRRAQMASLDDDERAEFVKNLELENAGQLRTQVQDYEQQIQEMKAKESYTQFFIDQGVPVDKLVRNDSLDALVNSGWSGIQAIIKDQQKELDMLKNPAPPPATSPTPTPQVRSPISAAPAPAGTGPTWADLIQRYGSQEEVYRMVEQGDLPPSIIPIS